MTLFSVLASVDGKVIQTAVWVLLRMTTCSLNYATGGRLHEPFCSRVWRCHTHGRFPAAAWGLIHTALNAAFYFDPDHCWKQYLKTAQRKVEHKWSITWLWQTF